MLNNTEEGGVGVAKQIQIMYLKIVCCEKRVCGAEIKEGTVQSKKVSGKLGGL